MKSLLSVILIFIVNLNLILAQNFSEVKIATGLNPNEDDRFGYSVSISDNYAIISSHYSDKNENDLDSLVNAGSCYIYEKDSLGNWFQHQKIVASDRGEQDLFGRSVAISGNYAVVGTYAEEDDENGLNKLTKAGSAYIFERNANGVWEEVQKIVASDRSANDYFANAVDIHGNYIIIGAHYEDEDTNGLNFINNCGSAYIFERNSNGVWNEIQKLKAFDRGAGDLFGRSVSISDDFAVIGAYQESEDENSSNTLLNAGSVYVFKVDASGRWNHFQKLTASDRNTEDRFGYSVDISKNYIVAGAYWEDNNLIGVDSMKISGSAYVFELNTTNMVWEEKQKLVASDREPEGVFGVAASIDNNYIVIGASGESKNILLGDTMKSAGAAYIFKRNENEIWVELKKLVASNRDTLAWFGRAVGVSNEVFLIGSNYSDSIILNSGLAYFYEDICTPFAVNISLNDFELISEDTNANYRWLDCKNNYSFIEGEDELSYSIVKNGSFALELRNKNNCVDTSDCLSIENLGIDNHEFKNPIQIYPNPSTGKVKVEIENYNKVINLNLFSSEGKLIKSIQPIDYSTDLDILTKGIFYLKIYFQDEIRVVKLINN